MPDPNLHLLEAAARTLEPLLDEIVFVGGCVTGLLITDPAAAGMRATTDVDVLAETYSYAGYSELSNRLRELGLTEDNREGAPPHPTAGHGRRGAAQSCRKCGAAPSASGRTATVARR